ncbi:MAG: hypothetical protein M1608_11815, partial [Candidatus Omnitrophica bacterium]|nr:hypothetical protein [Candidatus Omnitrophota bacterium]
INGFVFQQVDSNANVYYCSFGSASGWMCTRGVKLKAGVWQHVACVKTPTQLRVYVNGLLSDTAAAQLPIATSPLNFRVGLGFPDPSRCFKGLLDTVRVWNRVLSFKPFMPENEWLEQFVSLAKIEVRSTVGGRLLFRSGERAGLELSMNPELVPSSIQNISVSFKTVDLEGRESLLDSTQLRRTADFKAETPIPSKADYYRVTYKPSVILNGVRTALPSGVFAISVMPPHCKEKAAMPARTPGEPCSLDPSMGCISTRVVSLDGNKWLVSTDPSNSGRDEKWWLKPRPGARKTKVPWIIQDIFPGYQGVAWYWREFSAPSNPHPRGRFLLRFQAVDYLAAVWVNGIHVGSHEGGETPFVLDATDAVKPGGQNLVAVRVLNPTSEAIDGIILGQTPHGCKNYPVMQGGVYNTGGIVDSVHLLVSPVVRIENLFVRPELKTSLVRIQANLRNAGAESIDAAVQFSVAPAASGETLETVTLSQRLPPGDSLVETELKVENPHLWDLNDPFLYRVTARAWQAGSASFDEQSVRCGFREVRFENGYFRLNGRRIFLNGPLDLLLYPIGFRVPHDPDVMRRMVLSLKTLGFNVCRLVFGGTTPRELDLFDELGVMAYQESFATWLMQDSPRLEELYDKSWAELIKRDRNHPSVIAWGMLNETSDGRLFRHVVDTLPLVRYLDDSRIVMLSSGRWDNDYSIGSLCNPGSFDWESPLRDVHMYPPAPYTIDVVNSLRTSGTKEHPLLLSENGVGGANDLPRLARHYEQLGAEYADDARFYKDKLDRFMADWERWRLSEVWARPEDFFTESQRNMARLRIVGVNAIRSNPNLVGYFPCAIKDSDFDGIGMITAFGEPKPMVTEAMVDTTAHLRWCLFVEPVNVYRGTKVQLEAVLSNFDVMKSGQYPVRIQVVGPDLYRVLDRTVNVTIPNPKSNPEPSFVIPAFSETMAIDGPSGRYRLLVTFQKGGAATGGETDFYVTDQAEMPDVETEITLWGNDPDLAKWLIDHNIRYRPFASGESTHREVILASGPSPSIDGSRLFSELARHIVRGSCTVFLSPGLFRDGENPVAWVPLAKKGSIQNINWCGGYYRADAWAKKHPIFDGLPSAGILDYNFYREIIPQVAWCGLDAPMETIAGDINATFGYSSGIEIAVFNLGAGKFILNVLKIRENLGDNPAAERLLRNLLRYAAQDVQQPMAALPPDFNEHLKKIGYAKSTR